MKPLIVGEAGEEPWLRGSASERLWRWFGCKSREELAQKYELRNVITFYGGKWPKDSDMEHVATLVCECEQAPMVFLVGRVAQRVLCPIMSNFVETYRAVVWRHGKYVYVTHPSGLNRRLNFGGDKLTSAHLKQVLRQEDLL